MTSMFVLLLILSKSACAYGEAAKAKQEQRTIHFPDQSIGSLHVVPARKSADDPWMMYGYGNQVGGAQDTVTLNLAPGSLVMMDANRRVFENPALLKQVSPDGIDILKLGFIPMEDREDHYLGRAISYVDNLKGLRALFLDRSDADDADVLKLKGMKHLRVINLFLSRIDGSCFKGLSAFPELDEIDAPFCHLEQRHISDLSKIPTLKKLDLARTDMNVTGASSLPKLTSVIRLSVSGNPKFDDQCLKFLKAMPQLRFLDLRGTKVTFDAVKTLNALKLKTLCLPQSFRYRTKDIATLFPGVNIVMEDSPQGVSQYDRRIYAPLK